VTRLMVLAAAVLAGCAQSEDPGASRYKLSLEVPDVVPYVRPVSDGRPRLSYAGGVCMGTWRSQDASRTPVFTILLERDGGYVMSGGMQGSGSWSLTDGDVRFGLGRLHECGRTTAHLELEGREFSLRRTS